MTWVRASYNFDVGMGLFSISQRELAVRGIDLSQINDKETEGLAFTLGQLVVLARPDLAGCSVYYMGFDPKINAWQVGVIHPSLRKYGPFDCISSEAMFLSQR